jgi:hypothetical protein
MPSHTCDISTSHTKISQTNKPDGFYWQQTSLIATHPSLSAPTAESGQIPTPGQPLPRPTAKPAANILPCPKPPIYMRPLHCVLPPLPSKILPGMTSTVCAGNPCLIIQTLEPLPLFSNPGTPDVGLKPPSHLRTSCLANPHILIRDLHTGVPHLEIHIANIRPPSYGNFCLPSQVSIRVWRVHTGAPP